MNKIIKIIKIIQIIQIIQIINEDISKFSKTGGRLQLSETGKYSDPNRMQL